MFINHLENLKKDIVRVCMLSEIVKLAFKLWFQLFNIERILTMVLYHMLN